ncbi:MAG: hypothetical protein OEZ40_01610 [Candidatus Bathyarchaeota archaeon]|nr:hypothetical protein [Candidatus Bathyarchaeota archaeon]
MTELYEYIDNSIAAVSDFTSYLEGIFQGIILSQKSLSDFDTLIAAEAGASDWKDVAKVKRFCEICGWESSTVNTHVKSFLLNMDMFDNYAVPEMTLNTFTIGHPAMHGYRWAKELNYQTVKWDADDAFTGIHAVLVNEADTFYRANIDAGTGSQDKGGRIYEKNQTGCTFFDLWESAGVASAKTDLLQCWTYLQTHWNESGLNPPDRYDYAKDTGYDGWVWDTPEILEVFGRMQVALGYPVTNFKRIYTHAAAGYLDAKWASRHWIIDGGTQYEVCVHHNDANSERRMQGTFQAHVFLHQIWNHMTDTQKDNYRDMLKGTTVTQAYQTLLSATAGLYNTETNAFKLDSTDGATSDVGTASGATLLFLLGMCPSTTRPVGTLAIPLYTQMLGSMFMVGPKSFRWDGTNKKIRIAVFSGNLTFMYGSTNVDHYFPRDGVYEVYFSEDYNTVLNAAYIGPLPGKYYLDLPEGWNQTWNDVKRTFSNSKMLSTVVLRRLTLSTQTDATTGWYDKEYLSDVEIEAIITPKGASTRILGVGIYASKSSIISTAYTINDGDQIIYNGSPHEVENMEIIPKGDKTLCYRADLKMLPLRVEA